MLATVRAALDEAEKVGGEATAERVAQAVSFGALMGARGNSGVITSQILARLADGLAGKKRFNGLDLANALDEGTKTAYKAVAKPVEGTILTVIRESSAAAVAAAERDNDVEKVLAALVDAAERSVARTPSLLPILREARRRRLGRPGPVPPVPGGARGVRGRPSGRWRAPGGAARRAWPVVAPRSGRASPRSRRRRSAMRRCSSCAPADGRASMSRAIQRTSRRSATACSSAGDARMVKVHVHNERPDESSPTGCRSGP